MFRTALSLIVALLVTAILAPAAGAQDIRSEYVLSVGDFFEVPIEAVTDLQDVGLEDEELPVALFIAQRARVSPTDVAAMRVDGNSWSDVAAAFGAGPSDFYVMISGKIESRKYAAIMNKFKALPQSQWSELPLTDADIVNLVNLKFVYRHHDYSVFEVMAMREVGKSFVRINYQVAELRADMIRKEMAQKPEQE